jgi:hypothetical protein
MNLLRWVNSIAESVNTGATYSMGFPLQPEEWCNEVGQVYYGPAILVTDALSYSTTDIFAAGFQDNGIGEILGTSDNTGAGGANMWYYDDLIGALGKSSKTQFKPLPRDTDMQLAMRRSVRIGPCEGRPLEELGVNPDHRHYMTRRDLLDRNIDLIRKAARILKTKPVYSLSVQPVKSRNRALRINAASKVQPRDHKLRISRVDIFVNGRPHKSLSARNGALLRKTVSLGKPQRSFDWLVQAFDYNNNLVAVARRH